MWWWVRRPIFWTISGIGSTWSKNQWQWSIPPSIPYRGNLPPSSHRLRSTLFNVGCSFVSIWPGPKSWTFIQSCQDGNECTGMACTFNYTAWMADWLKSVKGQLSIWLVFGIPGGRRTWPWEAVFDLVWHQSKRFPINDKKESDVIRVGDAVLWKLVSTTFFDFFPSLPPSLSHLLLHTLVEWIFISRAAED